MKISLDGGIPPSKMIRRDRVLRGGKPIPNSPQDVMGRRKKTITEKKEYWYNPNTGEVRDSPFYYTVVEDKIITRLVSEDRYEYKTESTVLWWTLGLGKVVRKYERHYFHYYQFSYRLSSPDQLFDIKEWDDRTGSIWVQIDSGYNWSWAEDEIGIRDNQITIGPMSVVLYDTNRGWLPDFKPPTTVDFLSYDWWSDNNVGSILSTEEVLNNVISSRGESTVSAEITTNSGRVIDPLRFPEVSASDASVEVRGFQNESGQVSIGYGTKMSSYKDVAEHMYVTKDDIARAGFVSLSKDSPGYYTGWIESITFKPLHEVELKDGEVIVRGRSGITLIRLVTDRVKLNLAPLNQK